MTDLKQPPVQPGFGTYRRRTEGARLKRRGEIDKKRKRRVRRLYLVSLVVAIVVALAVGLFQGYKVVTDSREKPPVAAAQNTHETWLLIGTREADVSREADWLTVISYDRVKQSSIILYLPRSTFTEIPGHGQEVLAKAMSLGNETLMLSTASNLLGIQFDHHLRISDQAIQALFDKFGGVTIDVDQKLTKPEADGRVSVLFATGRQPLDGKRTAEFMSYVNETGDEVSRGARHSRIWTALLDRFRTEPARAGELFRDSKDLFVTDADAKQLDSFFKSIASTKPESITFETLPVKSTGISAETSFYAPDREAMDAMVVKYLSGSRPKGGGRAGRRVEILNGNGVPGIGQEVSDVVISNGFRVVLDQNAKHFNYPTTQIVVYSDSRSAIRLGEEIKRLLGVGEVVVSRRQQSVVDVTVVVGKDFLNRKNGS